MALTKTGSQRMVKGIGNGVLVMFLWTAIPFYWMFVTSLKHDKEIYGYEATLIPERPTIANYVTIIKDSPTCSFCATVPWWRCAPRYSRSSSPPWGPMPSRA